MEKNSKKLCGIRFSLEGFTADWRHCDMLSNYLARATSFDRPDSFLYSNLLSTMVNELLEVVFRHHGPGPWVEIGIWERSPDTLIELDMPVDEDSRAFLNRLILEIEQGDPESLYLEELRNEQANPTSIGFFELAANYGAKMVLEDQASGNVKLVLTVDLNEEW